MRLSPSPGVRFSCHGTVAQLGDEPDVDPSAWAPRTIARFNPERATHVGSGQVLVAGGPVHVVQLWREVDGHWEHVRSFPLHPAD